MAVILLGRLSPISHDSQMCVPTPRIVFVPH